MKNESKPNPERVAKAIARILGRKYGCEIEVIKVSKRKEKEIA